MRSYIASESFIADYDGERTEVIADRTVVSEDHELRERFPDRFELQTRDSGADAARAVLRFQDLVAHNRRVGLSSIWALIEQLRDAGYHAPGAYVRRMAPANGTRPSVRRQSGAREPWRLPAAVRPAEPPAIEIRTTGEPKFKVRLSAGARRMILDEARLSRDGFETGGGLFGQRWWSWKPTIEVTFATEPGPDTIRWPQRLQRDIAHRARIRRSLEHLTEVGDWHTHPSGTPTPTPADAVAWVSDLDHLRGTAYLGVIVTPDPVRGWDAPQLHAWVIHRAPHTGTPRVERASVA